MNIINKILLTFDPKNVALAGEKDGKKIYKEQVRGRIKDNMLNIIVFPEHIRFVAISFVKGLTSELQKIYGRPYFFEHIDFEARHTDWLTSKIKESVFF